jgi:hypothetical protein
MSQVIRLSLGRLLKGDFRFNEPSIVEPLDNRGVGKDVGVASYCITPPPKVRKRTEENHGKPQKW